MTDTQNTGMPAVRVGRNPQEEKAKVRKVLGQSAFRRLPVRRYDIGGKGKNRDFTFYTVKPGAFPDELRTRLSDALKTEFNKEVNVRIVAEAVSLAKNVRRTPLKVRHILKLVRGQRVDKAMAILQFTPNFAAEDIMKVVKSAAANAENGWGAEPQELVISECYADKAAVMKRFKPGPMGRARPILKFLSHITVVLSDVDTEL